MLRPKPNVEKLLPVAHGGLDYAELQRLGLSPEEVLDFSVSTNPFGPPPGLAEEMCRAEVERYPDSESSEVVSLLADRLGVTADNLVIGSGSTELIRLAASAYFGSGDSVIIPQPVYGDYEMACNLADAGVIKLTAAEKNGFGLDLSVLLDQIKRDPPRSIFLCNPNNPTGQYLTRAEIKQILSAAPDSLIILDEAYVAFVDDAWSSLDLTDRGNLLVLRSMTKDYALAGLRLGYAVADKSIIAALKRVKAPWNVSSVAQKAGVYALNSQEYLESCRVRIREAKDFLVQGLQKLGLKPLPSRAHFFLVKVGDSATVRADLFRKGLLVRDCSSFGLPGYIRLATRSQEDCQKLIEGLKGVVKFDR